MTTTILGAIDACIAGDWRYSTRIELRASDDSFDIVTRDTGAAGGMDSQSGAYALPERVWISLPRSATNVRIIRELRRCIASNGVVRRYGKPSKRFEWRIGDERATGVSATLCQRALVALRKREREQSKTQQRVSIEAVKRACALIDRFEGLDDDDIAQRIERGMKRIAREHSITLEALKDAVSRSAS